MTNIGSLVKFVRKQSGLTQEKLAERSDLSINFISRLERTANQNISWKNLESIAEALGLTVIELLQFGSSQEEDSLFLTKLNRLLNSMEEDQAASLSESFIDIIRTLNLNKK